MESLSKKGVVEPVIIKAAGNAINWIIGLGVLGVGAYFGKKAYDEYRKGKQTAGLANDPSSVIARQIADEVKSYPANDEVILRLFQQITDFAAVAKAYKIYTGEDIMEAVKRNVSSSIYTQITNLVSYSAGTRTPAATQSKAVAAQHDLFVVAKGDGYIRKTPVIPSCGVISDRFCYKDNVIAEIKGGEYAGRSTRANLTRQAEFTDKKNNVVFIEIQVTDKDDPSKRYLAYIAASNASVYKNWVKGWKWRKIDGRRYNAAKAPLNGIEQSTGNNLL